MGGCPWGIAGRWWFILSRQLEEREVALTIQPRVASMGAIRDRKRKTGLMRGVCTRLSSHSNFQYQV